MTAAEYSHLRAHLDNPRVVVWQAWHDLDRHWYSEGDFEPLRIEAVEEWSSAVEDALSRLPRFQQEFCASVAVEMTREHVIGWGDIREGESEVVSMTYAAIREWVAGAREHPELAMFRPELDALKARIDRWVRMRSSDPAWRRPEGTSGAKFGVDALLLLVEHPMAAARVVSTSVTARAFSGEQRLLTGNAIEAMAESALLWWRMCCTRLALRDALTAEFDR